MRLAIFDIDGTLVPKPSTEVRFFRYLLKSGRIGPRQLGAIGTFTLGQWPRLKGQVIPMNKAYLTGHELAPIAALARQFISRDIVPRLFEPIMSRLQAHQAAGDWPVLLSGTPQFLADALGEVLDVAPCLGSLCAMRGSRFVNEPPVRHPHGAGKIEAAEQLASWTALPLSRAIAYGDSIHDAELFRRVGEAVAVVPDRRLADEAREVGWEVIQS